MVLMDTDGRYYSDEKNYEKYRGLTPLKHTADGLCLYDDTAIYTVTTTPFHRIPIAAGLRKLPRCFAKNCQIIDCGAGCVMAFGDGWVARVSEELFK